MSMVNEIATWGEPAEVDSPSWVNLDRLAARVPDRTHELASDARKRLIVPLLVVRHQQRVAEEAKIARRYANPCKVARAFI
jgi:hypothetical protein